MGASLPPPAPASDGVLWGNATRLALENFPVSGEPMDRAVIHAVALVKGCAAVVNVQLGNLEPDVGSAIAEAADEVTAGLHSDQFPVDVFQTGSGTSTNMNVNEVLASLASKRLGLAVHPNDHVNRSQSSNDVIPSAIAIAVCSTIVDSLQPALRVLADELRSVAARTDTVVKAGRTHLMDAVPMRLGDEFGGYATQIERGIERLGQTLGRAGELPLGGTAVGTGLNCPPGFAAAVVAAVAARTGLALTEARDHFEAQGSRDALVEVSGALRVVAISLFKIADDLRLMSSGPAAGLAEISLPELQPGSSIMPGKVNPVLCESVQQVAAQVIGNDAAVAFSGAHGNFELNTMMPVMARNLMSSIRLLSSVVTVFARRCVAGIEVDQERCRRQAGSSPALATALVPDIGYESAAALVHEALASSSTIEEVAVRRGLDADRVRALLDLDAMSRPHSLRDQV